MPQVRIELPDPFPSGARKLAFVEGRQILVFNIEGRLVAIDNSCPHAGGSLFGGKLEGRVLRCPSHGMRIDLLAGGSADGVRSYAIAVDGSGALLTLD